MNSKQKKKNLIVNLVFKNGAEKLMNEVIANQKEIQRLQSENSKLLEKGIKSFMTFKSSET
jgi:hypothetical protein